MPHIPINGCNYYYELHGNPNAKETIVFAHGLLWSGKMFYKQVEYLKKDYRILTYDHRGQGKSEVTESGYDIDDLYKDTVELIQKLNLGKVHFMGLSMGGFVGMRVAARNPEMFHSLVLMETSAKAEHNRLKYLFLVSIVKIFGVKIVAQNAMSIMFGDTFLNDRNRKEEKKQWQIELENNPKEITRAVEGVIYRKGVEEELKNIQCPVLILVGTEDKATPPEKANFIHSKIPQSQLRYIPKAGHTSTIEEPEQVNRAIEGFLKEI